MKRKTSVTLSVELLHTIDRLSGDSGNRSQFIEMALLFYIDQTIRKERNARDIELINLQADRLNEEALDVLAYQVDG